MNHETWFAGICRHLTEREWLYLIYIRHDDTIQDANAAARRLLGMPETGNVSVDRSSTPLAALNIPPDPALISGGDEAMQEIELTTPSGLLRSFQFRLTPVPSEAGEAHPGRSVSAQSISVPSAAAQSVPAPTSATSPTPSAYLCVGLDVSRRRRAENRVTALYDESRDMIFACGPDDRIREVNEAGAQLLGITDPASLIKRKITDFYVSLADRDYYRQRMHTHGYVKDLEIVMRREDGRRIVVLDTSTAVEDADGTLVEYHGVLKDITERIRLEQEHMKMNIELAGANRELRHAQSRLVQQEKLASVGRLAAGVAHEINNPLSFVKSNLGTLRDYSRRLLNYLSDRPPTEIPADIRYILDDLNTLFDESEQGFERMTSIVQGLRNFARTGTDIRELYNLNTAVETTLAILRNEYKNEISVETELGELPDVFCVPDEINQVMLNILINAIQAIQSPAETSAESAESVTPGSKASGYHIRVTTGAADESVFCRIHDDGPGIPPEHRPQLFEPFFTTKPHGQGTGLGLSISYDIIVNKHGGDLKAEHPSDGGAAFIFTIPRYPNRPEM